MLTIRRRIANTFAFVSRTFQEKTHGHRDDRPDTRSKQSNQTAEESQQEYLPPRLAGCIGGIFTESCQLINNGRPIVACRHSSITIGHRRRYGIRHDQTRGNRIAPLRLRAHLLFPLSPPPAYPQFSLSASEALPQHYRPQAFRFRRK